MVLLKLLIFTLTLSELIVDLDAKICPKGQRVVGQTCEYCRDNSYQPKENLSQWCQPCRICDRESGSEVKEKCTRETNTKCQCRGEFVPRDSDSSTCKCDIGFGRINGECSKCGKGYFSARINSRCQKWKECTAGVKIDGNETADVICKEPTKSNTSHFVTTPPTSPKIVSLITRLTSYRPQGGNKTQKTHTTATTTATTSASASVSARTTKGQPSITGNHIGMALLMFGVVGLLVLTSVTCKLHITTCMEKEPAVQKNDSLCRRPIEESGESLSSLKLNPEEP